MSEDTDPTAAAAAIDARHYQVLRDRSDRVGSQIRHDDLGSG